MFLSKVGALFTSKVEYLMCWEGERLSAPTLLILLMKLDHFHVEYV